MVLVDVTVGYADVDTVHRLLDEMDVTVQEEEYGADVCYRCAVAEPEMEAFARAVANATRGQGRVRPA